jgi:hypothetical protein
MRRVPSGQISSRLALSSVRVVSSATTVNIGVPSPPAFACRQLLLVKQESTPRVRYAAPSTKPAIHNFWL